jgi:hypothetical protein
MSVRLMNAQPSVQTQARMKGPRLRVDNRFLPRLERNAALVFLAGVMLRQEARKMA